MKPHKIMMKIVIFFLLSVQGVMAENQAPTITSNPPPTSNTFENYYYHVIAIDPEGERLSYSLENAPTGMSIRQSGILVWMPTDLVSDSGNVRIVVKDPQGATVYQTINIAVVDNGGSAPVGIYVANNGTNEIGRGSISTPYATIDYANARSAPGDTIYVRGGNYYHPNYGDDNVNGGVYIKIAKPGTQGHPVTFRPFGDEYVKFYFDSSSGIRINADYINLYGFEIEGPAANYTVDDVLRKWWSGLPQVFMGRGVEAIGRHHIHIKDMIVHHCGAGGFVVKDSDKVKIEGNIVYNNAWWQQTGGTGMSVKVIELASGGGIRAEVFENLSFGNEQRVYSVNFANGEVSLRIDECPGISLKASSDYTSRLYAHDNYSFFNGKKGIKAKSAHHIDIYNNSVYHNGTTVARKNSGIDVNGSDIRLRRNAMHLLDGYSLSMKPSKISNSSFSAKYAVSSDSSLMNGITAVQSVFIDPENLDFRPAPGRPSDTGASLAAWNRLKGRCDDYGIIIKTTGYVPDNKYMSEWIVLNQPKTGTLSPAHFTVTVFNPPAEYNPSQLDPLGMKLLLGKNLTTISAEDSALYGYMEGTPGKRVFIHFSPDLENWERMPARNMVKNKEYRMMLTPEQFENTQRGFFRVEIER